MTSITYPYGHSYYQLNGQNASTDSSLSTHAPSLMDAINGTSNTSSSDSGDSVNLSPEAKRYLASQRANGTSGATSFTLTSAQQKTLNDILTKYKDAPFTQDTFDKIQDDLNAAGISAQTLAIKDQVKNYNPVQIFLQALNGEDVSSVGGQQASDEKAKSSSYMQMIIDQWKKLSDANAASGAEAGVGASGATGG